jgi:soluble lytic murein transglycosylase
MPKSVEKDYYIWRYLSSAKATKNDAKKLIREAYRINGKLARVYHKKTGRKAPENKKSKPHFTKKQFREYKEKEKNTLRVLNSKHPYSQWLKLSTNMKIFAFNHAGKSGRKALDKPIEPSLFTKLTTKYNFNDSIYRIKKDNLKNFSKALLNPPAKNNKLSYDNLMMLGYNGLKYDKKGISEMYFRLASQKAQKREQLDKALFWAYLSQKNKEYLKSLTGSYVINIYTLIARDILHLKYPSAITPDLPSANLMDNKISDPIHWANLKKKIFSKKYDLKKLSNKYRSSESVGYYSYIMAKASREKDQYFPMPYRNYLSKLSKERQAILYAVARQESRFVPACISTSYAVGMMQFMPFLVKHIAKKRKEKFDLDSMFNPNKSLEYANEHMKYLYKWLQHPLFVAYAYNAGIGFTRKMIRKKHMFNGKGDYEPYLSLELVDNDQARHYGKRVIANYVVYMNKLGKSIRISDLLSTLHQPEKTDKFRKRKK